MKSNSKTSTIESDSSRMFKPTTTIAPKAIEEQLTPDSSSSPYTITSSLSSSSCSLPVAVPLPPTTKPPSNKKSSITSSSTVHKTEIKQSANKLNESSLSSSSSSSSSVCSSHKCFISIWSIWYCLLVTALHIYLIKNRIVDIINLFSLNSDLFTLNNNSTNSINTNSFNNNTLNINELNASIYFEVISRLCLLILSIVFLILFLLCSLKPFGNYSNDGVKFGRDFFYEKIDHNHLKSSKHNNRRRLTQSERSSSCFTNLIEVIWRHFLPANSFFHLISILLLIFSRIVFNDSRKTMQTYSTIKSCLTTTTSTSSSSCLLNFYSIQANQSMSVFFNTDESNPNIFYFIEQIIVYTFELISICLSFVSIYIRYGSVFWFTNKSLSFLITFIGFIGAIEQLLQLYSFIYIYNQLNLNENIYWLNYFTSRGNLTNTNLSLLNKLSSSEVIESDKHSFLATFTDSFEFTFLIKNKFTLFFLYFTLSFLVYLSATPAYVFAFLKYKERFIIEESLFNRTILSKTKKEDYSYSSSQSSSSSSIDPVTNVRLPTTTQTTCCFNYCPHLIATIQLVLICASKLPFCYDYVIYFNRFKDFGICLVIISEIMHTIILIFIWLLLTLKTEWTMHLQTSFSICHWTYHLKHRRPGIINTQKFEKQPINMLTGQEQVGGGGMAGLKNNITELENNQFINNNNNNDDMKKCLDLNDFNQNRLTGNKFSTLLTYKQQQQQLNEPNIVIRNNVGNIYSSNKRQKMLETKHKSLMDENNIYNTNYNLEEEPQSGSDYLLNSETLYRNEIRKSIRNIMQQKQRCSSTSTAMIGSSATLMLNQQQKNNQEQLNKMNEPFYFHTENGGKKRLVSGVYLTSTTPTIIDNATNNNPKPPTLTHIMTSTICSTTNQLDNQNNKNRSVLYLERRTSASNEYESRV